MIPYYSHRVGTGMFAYLQFQLRLKEGASLSGIVTLSTILESDLLWEEIEERHSNFTGIESVEKVWIFTSLVDQPYEADRSVISTIKNGDIIGVTKDGMVTVFNGYLFKQEGNLVVDRLRCEVFARCQPNEV